MLCCPIMFSKLFLCPPAAAVPPSHPAPSDRSPVQPCPSPLRNPPEARRGSLPPPSSGVLNPQRSLPTPPSPPPPHKDLRLKETCTRIHTKVYNTKQTKAKRCDFYFKCNIDILFYILFLFSYFSDSFWAYYF